jgi:hypothetical protein
MGAAVDYVVANSDPDQPVAVLPYHPLVSFLANRRAPHRATYTFWPIEYIPGRERQIIDAMEAVGSRFLVYHFTQFVQFPRMQEYAPELFAYLVETYEMDRVISDPRWGMMLAGLRRSDVPSEGRALVEKGAANAEVAIQGPNGSRRPVPPAQRKQLVATALWPFRPVVAMRPLANDRRNVMTVSVDVGADSRLRTAVGVHPRHWFEYPPARVTFEIWTIDGGERSLLAARTLDPQGDHRDRGWFEIDVPLDAHAGRSIDLEFTTGTDRNHGEVPGMGGWAIPRLVTRRASAPPPADSTSGSPTAPAENPRSRRSPAAAGS